MPGTARAFLLPTMVVLVCGGLSFADKARLFDALDRIHRVHPISRVIHGAAKGADNLAKWWASERGISCRAYPADWQRFRKAAGPIRNAEMLAEGKPELVVAFDGGKGTANMVQQAKSAGVPIVHR